MKDNKVQIPIQILFVNLATDGLPAIALGVDPADKDIMRQAPRDRKEGIFARGLTEKILVRGSLIGICTLLSFMVEAQRERLANAKANN